MKIKKFLCNQKGQAFVEAIIFIVLVYIFIAIALIQFGMIQLCRERLAIANYYMGYTQAVAKRPGRLINKTKLMLKNGTPNASSSAKYIENMGLRSRESRILAKYKINSSIMQKIAGKDKLTINSHKLSIKGPGYK